MGHKVATKNHIVKITTEGDKLPVVDKKGRQVYLYTKDYFTSPYVISLINSIVSGSSVISDATLTGDGTVGSPLGVTNPFPGFTSLTADYGVTLATVATSGDYNDLINPPTIHNAVGNNQVQFSVTGGSFTTHDLIWESSNSSFSPLNNAGASLGANGRFFSVISGNKHTALAGTTNGFRFTGSGTSAQITAQAGLGDGLTFWTTSTTRKMNIAVSQGVIITDGALGVSQEANDDVTLELAGKSILRLAGVAAATITAISTPLDGMIGYATDTDTTFTSEGLWTYEEGAWKKIATFIPQSFSFTRNNDDFLQENSAGYTSMAKIIYAGSDKLGIPAVMEVNAWNDGATSASVEIFDVTNGNQIAEVTGITSASEANIASLGALSDVPTSPAVLEIRMLRVGGGMGDNAKISSLTIR